MKVRPQKESFQLKVLQLFGMYYNVINVIRSVSVDMATKIRAKTGPSKACTILMNERSIIM